MYTEMLGLSWPEMTTGAYWIALIVGGGLVALSTLSLGDMFGGHDIDVSADIGIDGHVDFGHDVGGHDVGATEGVSSLATWLSFSFLVYFLFAFGAIGLLLASVAEAGPLLSLIGALTGGGLIGQIAHQMRRSVQASSGNSATRPEDYVNRIGRVSIGIEPGRRGEVALQVRGTERYVPAVTLKDGARFLTGARVFVVAYRAGVAEVVSPDEAPANV
ncbi:MAG: hypothetical protein KDA32_14205 [Phycisphaerales bacterium]|nr:hypothetical protein [Phycisphaerales bacterium]